MKNRRPENKITKLFLNFRFILILYIIIALVATAQSFFQGPKIIENNEHSHYNNYNIFKYSYYHLLEGSSLYRYYPEEHYDLYKYSPTFSLFFGPMASLPDLVGMSIWNLINVLLLLYAIRILPGVNDKFKVWLLLLVLFELVGSIQNEQSNGMMAALIILGFSFLERKNYILASLFIVCTIFIKLFGVVALALFIFYPKKLKLIGYTLFWIIFLLAVPLLVTSFSNLIFQYEEWGILLAQDHSESLGISFYGLIQSWFHLDISKNFILLIGVLLFVLPLIKYKNYHSLRFRLLMLSSILIWVVIFNHKAESPTFVIAMSGIGVYLFSERWTNRKKLLLMFSLLLTSIVFQDFIPRSFRNEYIIHYNLKVLPSVIVWFMVIWEMLMRKDWNVRIEQTNAIES